MCVLYGIFKVPPDNVSIFKVLPENYKVCVYCTEL